MANSIITIVFGQGLAVDEVISFKYKDLASATPTIEHLLSSVWKQPRTQAGQVNRNDPAPLPYTSQLCSLDYYSQFITDYNVPSIFIVKTGLNSVTVEAKNAGIEFLTFTTTDPSVTATITNVAYSEPYGIETINFAEATNNCTHVKIQVTTNIITDTVSSPVALTPNSTNFEFDYLRNTLGNISATAGLETTTKGFTTPSILESPTVNITNTPSGANVLLSVGNPDLTVQWSLDGVTYQSSSIYQSILTGSYTAYVKDQYNCVKTTAFTVDIFTPQQKPVAEIFYISDVNSIRFKEYEIWDNKNIYKTEGNTLAIEESTDNNRIIYPFSQKWQQNDIEPIEVTSSFEDIICKVYQNGLETILPVEKKTTNIGRKDKRDARIFQRTDGNTGIYFLSGNTYDYDTGNLNGSYPLNEPLPEWAVIGNSIFIDETNTFLTINDIELDPQKGKQVLVLDPVYTGTEKNTIVSTIYNLFDFEIYRIKVDMSQFSCFQLLVEASDSVFSTRTKLSEIQKVLEFQKGTVELKYKGTENKGVYYTIDSLAFTLRLDYNGFYSVTEDEREIHKSDTRVLPLNGEQYDKYEITIPRLPTAMATKVMKAFGQDIVSLNRELFTTESVEKTKTGNTNLYEIKATIYRTQEDIADSSNINLIFPPTYSAPSLLNWGGGFIVVDSSVPNGYLSVI